MELARQAQSKKEQAEGGVTDKYQAHSSKHRETHIALEHPLWKEADRERDRERKKERERERDSEKQ